MSAYTGSVPDTEPADTWRAMAVCAGPDYATRRDLWFSTASNTEAIREARRVCWSCPVIRECLNWAFAHREDRGIWGGMTEKERRRIHGRPAPKHYSSDVNAPGRRGKAAA